MLFLHVMVAGVLLGMVYALIGLGLNIIYGVVRIVNFAHGEFLMLASYAAYWAFVLLGLDPLTCLAFVIPGFFLLGILIHYLTVPLLQNSEDPEIASYLAFFGISLVLSSGALMLWGADLRGIPFPYGNPSASLGGIHLPTGRVLAFLVSVIGSGGVAYFFFKTLYGKAIRAIIQNREAARLVGIDVNKLSALAFGLGLSLVGIAGALITLVFPAIHAGMGGAYTITAFLVIVLGGIGRPMTSLAGGLALGVIESLSMAYTSASIATIIKFALLVCIIMFRPAGLVGKPQ